MRRVFVMAAILSAVGWTSGTAWAEVPSHDRSITKDVAITVPPLAECPAPGAASIDLVFNEQFHVNTTSDTFHLTDTLNGTFTTRDANGNASATGHFVAMSSLQQPGEPLTEGRDHRPPTTDELVDEIEGRIRESRPPCWHGASSNAGYPALRARTCQ